MGLLKADIDQMNSLATVLGDVGQKIDDIEIRAAVGDIKAALPGCPIPDACAKAGESTEYAWLKVADRIRSVATAVQNTAADINATDESFKRRLEAMSFHDKDR
ncbi:hypothetical protein [Nocardia brasiliensis]|uniref:Uncharacterized protein n=1 Tax=Nocardia brasiliensis (strain ATCC 700358 / HUJEG-1) TaxID=1133849 RepID=K0F904_NOCB7|nr:hypothetical protein [Nocardia brasiliensis]AFU06234.1 hypothetical protein O3I_041445 [Nocardia brasiliensis ATCC 700358]OCF88586.1 hypothetical protein AW168_19855 [Nocardia brasiliensis]